MRVAGWVFLAFGVLRSAFCGLRVRVVLEHFCVKDFGRVADCESDLEEPRRETRSQSWATGYRIRDNGSEETRRP